MADLKLLLAELKDEQDDLSAVLSRLDAGAGQDVRDGRVTARRAGFERLPLLQVVVSQFPKSS